MEFQILLTDFNNAVEDLYNLNQGIGKTENKEELFESIKRFIYDKSKQLYELSKRENIYWSFCSFNVYSNTYESRLSEFLYENDNATEYEFIELEIENIERLKGIWYFDYFEGRTEELIISSWDRKISYLNDRLENFENQDEIEEEIEEDIIDLCSTKLSEKLVYLHELGILEFLLMKEPFISSKNTLASALSGLIGEKAKSIQSAINPINNKSVSQKNNPLKSTKKVNIVRQKLISIGYKIDNNSI
jgi:6-pyruvoyl-tetrahydropterin synthase